MRQELAVARTERDRLATKLNLLSAQMDELLRRTSPTYNVPTSDREFLVADPMPVVILVIVAILAGTSFTLIIDGIRNRPRRPYLTERLLPYMPSVADEAESWLQKQ